MCFAEIKKILLIKSSIMLQMMMRETIALGGYNRLILSKNAVGDRIDQIVEDFYGYTDIESNVFCFIINA